jgi:hypothetical protein
MCPRGDGRKSNPYTRKPRDIAHLGFVAHQSSIPGASTQECPTSDEQMTGAVQELMRVVEGLKEEDQALVLAFANAIREREALRLPTSQPRDESEWRAWVGRVQTRGAQVLACEIERMRAAGLTDEKGPRPLTSLPEDMEPGSDTSVET